MKDICSSETSLFVSNDQGITDFNHQSRTCSRVFENSDLHQVAGVDIYCGKVVFTDTTENKIKILDIDGTTKDVVAQVLRATMTEMEANITQRFHNQLVYLVKRKLSIFVMQHETRSN